MKTSAIAHAAGWRALNPGFPVPSSWPLKNRSFHLLFSGLPGFNPLLRFPFSQIPPVSSVILSNPRGFLLYLSPFA